VAAPSLSVVVPARNEASRLEATFEALASALGERDSTEMILVLDSTSEDDTLAVGNRLVEVHPDLRVLVVDSKGKGNAVSVGVQASRGEIVVLADADLSVDPTQFHLLIGPASSGALAIASRSVLGSRRIGEPVSRFLFGRAFNLAVRTLILPGVHDTQCGFKAFPRDLFAPVFATLGSEGWCFDVELLARSTRMGVPVVEVPVTWRYGHGSKVSITRDAAQIVRDLLRLRRRFGRVRPVP
jgi:glycosyltransferase involved in cell wall biosynthesis